MCGDIESNEHFLMICPGYTQIRGDLLKVVICAKYIILNKITKI